MLFQEALAAKPEEAAAMAGLIRADRMGDFEGARDMSAALTDEMQDTDAVKAALAALNVAEEARPRRISSVILRRRLLPAR